MKRVEMKLIALALAASSVLSGCGIMGSASNENTSANTEETTGTEQAGENEITDLVLTHLASTEISTFNLLNSQAQRDVQYLTNMVDGLVEVDTNGQPVPCIATDWGSEDGGLTWTFNLREGVKWVDVNAEEKADCTAWDFASGLEWVLNFHKNDSANTSMPLEMIEGANEYYEYTKTLSKEEAYALTADDDSVFQQMVGIKTPDANTIVYTCTAEKPYFDTMATWAGMYPRAQAMVDELGGPDGVKSMNNENMWYNGCYTMTSYVQGNEKTLTKNPAYWDKDCKLFDTVTIKIVDSTDTAYQLYQSGEIDQVSLYESTIQTILDDPNHEYHDSMIPLQPIRSYSIRFNFDKYKEDGTPDTNWNTAAANKAFRLSIYYGLDLTNYYSRLNPLDPLSCENEYYTMKGLAYTSDGTDYTELVRQELGLPEMNGEKMVRLDSDKAEQYKQQAIEELTAAGVTFPIEIDYYISGSNQVSLDSANVLKQCFSDSLGDDYVTLNILTYVSSSTQEVITPRLHSALFGYGWGADYGDPQNYLGQMTYGQDTAYYSMQYNNINDVEENENTKALLDAYKEFTTMVDAANAINDDLDARYTAYAEAEAYMLEHVFVLPCYYQVGWCLTRVDNDTKMQPMFGSVGDKMKNWGSNVNGYTSEEKGVAELVAAYSSEQQ